MITISQLGKRQKSRLNNPKRKNRSSLLIGRPQRRGVCYKVTMMKPKKPNSANRKIAKLRLLRSRRRLTAYIPGMGHELREYSQVLIRGGRVPDLPGVQYHLIRGKYDFSWKERFTRIHGRSKYGIPRDQSQQFYKKR